MIPSRKRKMFSACHIVAKRFLDILFETESDSSSDDDEAEIIFWLDRNFQKEERNQIPRVENYFEIVIPQYTGTLARRKIIIAFTTELLQTNLIYVSEYYYFQEYSSSHILEFP